MRRSLLKRALIAATAAVAAVPALSAAAQESGDGGSGVVTPVLWSVTAIVVAGLALAVFQMLKRQLGGFENPEWVAPIGAVYSSDLPQDEPVSHDDPHHEGPHEAEPHPVEPAPIDMSHEIQDREAFPPQDPAEQEREAAERGDEPPDSVSDETHLESQTEDHKD